MKRAFALMFVFVLAVAVGAFAQAKPDFSGTWQLDAAKSDQMGGGGGGGRGPGGPITVKQTATELTRESSMGGQTMSTTYKLDGTETTSETPMGASKATAKWDGSKLVIKTTRESPNGTMETTETWTLSADGKELTIVRASSRGERKSVYTKQ